MLLNYFRNVKVSVTAVPHWTHIVFRQDNKIQIGTNFESID